MALRIQCPGCRNALQVEDVHRGKQVRCPTCNTVMQVPGPVAPPASQAITTTVPAPSQPPAPAFPEPSRFSSTEPVLEAEEELSVAVKKRTARRNASHLVKKTGHAVWSTSLRVWRPVAATAGDPTRTGRRWFLAGAGGGLALLIGLQILFGGAGETPSAEVQVAQKNPGDTPSKTPQPAPKPASEVKPAPPSTVAPDASKNVVKTSNYPVESTSKKPEPIKVLEPPPKQVEVPAGPAPPAMAADTTKRVKKATAYLRVTQGNGVTVEGSGFFAAEAGLVFTNAHVLGMMESSSKLPTKVDVVVHSGEASTEFTVSGQVLGVDRISDLGILRITDQKDKLPEPLPLAGSYDLTDLQKVYVFGFPFGASLGKNITISETSVSSFRNGPDGTIAQIQVNGGMNPGNSGGPVVDTRGVVVGVAVAGIRGTQINFAVPGEKAQGLLRGRVTDVEFGEPYQENGQVKLPVHVACADPLQRIRELRAEVWTGPPGKARPVSTNQPKPLPGDGPRSVIPLQYQSGKAEGAVVLPTVGGGQVLWLQPAVSDGASTLWASAMSYKPSDLPPLQRTAATLQRRFEGQPESTLKITCAFKRVLQGAMHLTEDLSATALEKAERDPRGGQSRLTFGPCTLSRKVGEKSGPLNPQAQTMLRSRDLTITTDASGAVLERKRPSIELFYPPGLRNGFEELVGHLTSTYEMTCITVPNKLVQPQESWAARVPVTLYAMGLKENVDLVLTCTFEGTRMLDGKNQGVIRLSGNLHTKQQNANSSGGKVTGRLHFGIQEGCLTRAEVTVEADGTPEPVMQMHVTLARTAGNNQGITPIATPKQRQLKQLQRTSAALSDQDRADDAQKRDCYYKSYPVNMTAGHTYLIEMNASGQGNQMDPYLVLVDPNGQKMAEDDDSGGNLNALIVFQAPTTGVYQVHTTTCEGRHVGPFTLRVCEIVTKD
jgi:LSD1 subclass zinc finger protein